MPPDFAAQLKGARKDAELVAEEIKKAMIKYGKNGDENAFSYQLKFGLHVMRNINLTLDAKGKHYDIYCDIIEQTLIPNIKPQSAKSQYWSFFLDILRYFHSFLVFEKINTEAIRLHKLAATLPNKIQCEVDYKYLLKMHLTHLHYQKSFDTNATKPEIVRALNALVELFDQMLLNIKEHNHNYPELLPEFVNLLTNDNRTQSILFIAALPTKYCNRMYTSFFNLLSGNALALTDIDKCAEKHLKALNDFLNIDMADLQLQHQLALQHLRCCRQLFQSNKSMGYIFSLLCLYLKLMYARNVVPDFSRTYVELCRKFVSFFESSHESLMQEQWFMDTIVIIQILHRHLHHLTKIPNKTSFDFFWQQMDNNVECYAAHFSLISVCIKLAARITSCKLFPLDCCTSIRKHTIIMFAQFAILAYCKFLAQPEPQSAAAVVVSEMCTTFTLIVRQACTVMNAMQCINSKSPNLLNFTNYFCHLVHATKVPAHARLFFKLLEEYLVKLRSNIEDAAWFSLLRRVYKMLEASGLTEIASQIHVNFICSQIGTDSDFASNQIGVYHDKTKREQSISEIYKTYSGPLKVALTAELKHKLFQKEMHIVLRYFVSNVKLLQSLMRCCRSNYDYILITRSIRRENDVKNKMLNIYHELKRRQMKDGDLTRLDNLVYAHTCSDQFYEQSEAFKLNLDSGEVRESSLEELLARPQLKQINVASEMALIEIARDALQSFEIFYNRADTEYISSDVAHIDWELMLENITHIALSLQLIGYIEDASNAWLLNMRIAQSIGDRYQYLRSVTFFCEYAQKIEHDKRPVDMDAAVERAMQIIIELTPNLQNAYKRYQNFVLLCLCQLSNYYACLGQSIYARLLLEYALYLRDDLPERCGKYDIIQFTVEIHRFRLFCYQQQLQQKQKKAEKTLRLSTRTPTLLQSMDAIVDKSVKFVCVSSVDAIVYITLLIEFAQQCVEFTSLRLIERNSIICTVLSKALQTGLTLRSIQLLVAWMHANLQMECMTKAESKLRLIEHMLCINTLSRLLKSTEQPTAKKASEFLASNDILSLHMNAEIVEPIREGIVGPQLSPGNNIISSMFGLTLGITKLDNFFDVFQTRKHLKYSEQLQWLYFGVGCLNARLKFLNKDYTELAAFYENAENWLIKQNRQSVYAKMYANLISMHIQYYINYLRATTQFANAIEYMEKIFANADKHWCNVDLYHRHSLWIQLEITRDELNTPSDLRRALLFNDTPEKKPQQQRTKHIETTKTTTKKISSSKTSKTKLKFAIYQSEYDIERPPNRTVSSFELTSSSSLSSSSDSDAIDLNACQPIQTIDLDDTIPDADAGQIMATKIMRTKSAPNSSIHNSNSNGNNSKSCIKKPKSRSATPELTAQHKPKTAKCNLGKIVAAADIINICDDNDDDDDIANNDDANIINLAAKLTKLEINSAKNSTQIRRRGRQPLQKSASIGAATTVDKATKPKRLLAENEQTKENTAAAAAVVSSKQTKTSTATAVKSRTRAPKNSNENISATVQIDACATKTRRRQRT